METAAEPSLSEPWETVSAAARTVRKRLGELGAAFDAPAGFAADTTVALLRAHAVCLRFSHTALPANLDLVWNWVAGLLTPSSLARFRTLAWLQIPAHERWRPRAAEPPAAHSPPVADSAPMPATVLEAARARFLRQYLALFAAPFCWYLPAAFGSDADTGAGEPGEPGEPELMLETAE